MEDRAENPETPRIFGILGMFCDAASKATGYIWRILRGEDVSLIYEFHAPPFDKDEIAGVSVMSANTPAELLDRMVAALNPPARRTPWHTDLAKEARLPFLSGTASAEELEFRLSVG